MPLFCCFLNSCPTRIKELLQKKYVAQPPWRGHLALGCEAILALLAHATTPSSRVKAVDPCNSRAASHGPSAHPKRMKIGFPTHLFISLDRSSTWSHLRHSPPTYFLRRRESRFSTAEDAGVRRGKVEDGRQRGDTNGRRDAGTQRKAVPPRNHALAQVGDANHECPPAASLALFPRVTLHTLRLRRHFSLACFARTRHNTPQINTPDEAATNGLKADMGRIDVTRPK
jgi:hypothetical protein